VGVLDEREYESYVKFVHWNIYVCVHIWCVYDETINQTVYVGKKKFIEFRARHWWLLPVKS
jgi:hypothetical protein